MDAQVIPIFFARACDCCGRPTDTPNNLCATHIAAITARDQRSLRAGRSLCQAFCTNATPAASCPKVASFEQLIKRLKARVQAAGRN